MNQAIKKKWLEKLKTARKARKRLRGNDKKGSRYCCLGVLCNLYTEEKGEGSWAYNPDAHSDNWTFLGTSIMLPAIVKEWADITFMEEGDLADANDEQPGFPIDMIKSL